MSDRSDKSDRSDIKPPPHSGCHTVAVIHCTTCQHLTVLPTPVGHLGKKNDPISANDWIVKKFPAPCYSPIVKFTVPSPLEPLTTVFGKGTCVTAPLWTPEKKFTIRKCLKINSELKKVLPVGV